MPETRYKARINFCTASNLTEAATLDHISRLKQPPKLRELWFGHLLRTH